MVDYGTKDNELKSRYKVWYEKGYNDAMGIIANEFNKVDNQCKCSIVDRMRKNIKKVS